MAGINYDFRAFFEKEAKNLIRTYKSLIAQKRGIEQDDAPSNKPSTVKKKGFDHWLVDTGQLKKNAFKSRASKKNLIVFASGDKHPNSKTATYRDLIKWHTKKYSGVFGIPVQSKIMIRLQKEYMRQTLIGLRYWVKEQNAKL